MSEYIKIERNTIPEYLSFEMPKEYRNWLERQGRNKENVCKFNGHYYVSLLPYIMYRLGTEDDENAKVFYSNNTQTVLFDDALFRFNPQKSVYEKWTTGEYEGKISHFEEAYFISDLFKEYGKYLKVVERNYHSGVCNVDIETFLADKLQTEVKVDLDEIYNGNVFIAGQKIRIKALREYEKYLYESSDSTGSYTHRVDEFKEAKYLLESISEELEKMDAPMMLSVVYDKVVSGELNKDDFLKKFGKK